MKKMSEQERAIQLYKIIKEHFDKYEVLVSEYAHIIQIVKLSDLEIINIRQLLLDEEVTFNGKEENSI